MYKQHKPLLQGNGTAKDHAMPNKIHFLHFILQRFFSISGSRVFGLLNI
jgi:hypothetical protein